IDRGEKTHPARLADEPDPARLQLAHERSVVGLPVLEVLRVQPERFDTGRAGPLQRHRLLAIGDDHAAAGWKARARAGIEKRLEIGTAAGGEDAEGQRHAASRRAGSVWEHTGQRDTFRMMAESRGNQRASDQSSATWICLRTPTSLNRWSAFQKSHA